MFAPTLNSCCAHADIGAWFSHDAYNLRYELAGLSDMRNPLHCFRGRSFHISTRVPTGGHWNAITVVLLPLHFIALLPEFYFRCSLILSGFELHWFIFNHSYTIWNYVHVLAIMQRKRCQFHHCFLVIIRMSRLENIAKRWNDAPSWRAV